MKINQLDLFSGIGGFHLGFERAGYKVNTYFSEVDPHAIAVYKYQFPNSTYVGSVTNVRGTDLPTIDLITFGSPCQDFSIAGKRKGMEGERSVLILEAIRLIRECRPRVFIWENVKGTFSSNSGEDFAAILKEFTDIGGYRLEWQLLNTSWFLPQNRERIYLVGYSAEAGRNWRGVFPIGESNRSDFKLQRQCIPANTILQRYEAGANETYIGECEFTPQIRVRSATSCGYEVASVGDTINISQPNSETRRGRVGKQKAQTLETSCNQATIQDYRIRRLTPVECERLQGFPDNHTAFGNYDGVVKPMSNTQRYKQCGNAVTVNVVTQVAEKCKKLFK
jgi:DNA (cytosine-5)-methyltransferase 1